MVLTNLFYSMAKLFVILASNKEVLNFLFINYKNSSGGNRDEKWESDNGTCTRC